MNTTPSELLMRSFNEIFIELDPVRRAELLSESYTEDCLWIHPGGPVVGRDGINEAASEIRRHFPEYRYTVTNEIQRHLDLKIGLVAEIALGFDLGVALRELLDH